MLLVFAVVNFALSDRFDSLVAPLSIIYIGVLSLYVGTKEFDRWYDMHKGRHHPGEWFVIVWTAVIASLFIGTMILGPAHKVPSEIVADYIAVLSIFALTQKSKRLHTERQSRQAKPK